MKLIKLDKNLKSINIIVLLCALQFRALKCKMAFPKQNTVNSKINAMFSLL